MKRFYFDFETYPIGPGIPAPKPVAMGYAVEDDAPRILLREPALDLLEERLRDPESVLVGQYIVFDLGVLVAHRPCLRQVFEALDAERIRCTQVQQQLIDIAYGESEFRRSGGTIKPAKLDLGTLAMHHCGLEVDKNDPWRLRYSELDGIPVEDWPEEARAYLEKDITSDRAVYKAQLALLGSKAWWEKFRLQPGQLPDLNRQLRYAWWMQLMHIWGVRTDGQSVTELRSQLVTEIEIRKRILREAGLMSGDTKKMEPCRARVKEWYESRGKKVPRTKGGDISTDGDALETTEDPSLMAWSEYVSLDKVLGTYVEGRGSGKQKGVGLIHGVDRPINARWNVLVDTGRTSCAQPNLQNPPRKGGVRGCFVPRPGYVYISADYDTAELRSLAQVQIDLFKTSALGDMLRAGMDPHLGLGGDLISLSYSDMVRRKREPKIKEARQAAKPANFGYPGGLGAETFVLYAWQNYELRFTLERSKEIREAWMKRYPEEEQRFAMIQRCVKMEDGTMRHHRSNRLRGECRFTQMANSMFQGMTADGAKYAGWLLSRECYGIDKGPLNGSRIVMFLHDEFIFEVPFLSIEHVDRCARRAEELMIVGMSKFVRDVPVTCSPAVMNRWYKGAEPVFQNGLYVPGKPEEKDGETIWVPDQRRGSATEWMKT